MDVGCVNLNHLCIGFCISYCDWVLLRWLSFTMICAYNLSSQYLLNTVLRGVFYGAVTVNTSEALEVRGC